MGPEKYNPISLEQIIDVNTIPHINSSKFSVYMSWFVLQKIKGLSVPEINIADENIILDINKIYKYFIDIDSNTIKNIIKWIDEYDFGNSSDAKTNYFDSCSIETIFNSDGKICKVEYDFIDNTNYLLKIINNEYRLIPKSSLINTDIYDDLTYFDDTYNDDEQDNDDNIFKSNNNKIIQKGGEKSYGIYNYKIGNDMINIYSVLPICKMFYFIKNIKWLYLEDGIITAQKSLDEKKNKCIEELQLILQKTKCKKSKFYSFPNDCNSCS